MANARARLLRSNATNAERMLWYSLRQLKAHGFHFRRQVATGGIIVDFACYSARLVIEVDDGQHNETKGRATDKKRDAFLRCNNFKVLRFWNNNVLNNTNGVMQTVYASLRETPPQPLPARGRG